jgi:hypothetical protein
VLQARGVRCCRGSLCDATRGSNDSYGRCAALWRHGCACGAAVVAVRGSSAGGAPTEIHPTGVFHVATVVVVLLRLGGVCSCGGDIATANAGRWAPCGLGHGFAAAVRSCAQARVRWGWLASRLCRRLRRDSWRRCRRVQLHPCPTLPGLAPSPQASCAWFAAVTGCRRDCPFRVDVCCSLQLRSDSTIVFVQTCHLLPCVHP